jgi:DNA (cytosine-5)-methyltransferase 1
VIGFYEPLIKPQELGMHYFWSNFLIPPFKTKTRGHYDEIEKLEEVKGFDLSDYDVPHKRLMLRNCVFPELGKHILYYAENPIQEQVNLF